MVVESSGLLHDIHPTTKKLDPSRAKEINSIGSLSIIICHRNKVPIVSEPPPTAKFTHAHGQPLQLLFAASISGRTGTG